jgi:hypothetical protein
MLTLTTPDLHLSCTIYDPRDLASGSIDVLGFQTGDFRESLDVHSQNCYVREKDQTWASARSNRSSGTKRAEEKKGEQ